MWHMAEELWRWNWLLKSFVRDVCNLKWVLNSKVQPFTHLPVNPLNNISPTRNSVHGEQLWIRLRIIKKWRHFISTLVCVCVCVSGFSVAWMERKQPLSLFFAYLLHKLLPVYRETQCRLQFRFFFIMSQTSRQHFNYFHVQSLSLINRGEPIRVCSKYRY